MIFNMLDTENSGKKQKGTHVTQVPYFVAVPGKTCGGDVDGLSLSGDGLRDVGGGRTQITTVAVKKRVLRFS